MIDVEKNCGLKEFAVASRLSAGRDRGPMGDGILDVGSHDVDLMRGHQSSDIRGVGTVVDPLPNRPHPLGKQCDNRS